MMKQGILQGIETKHIGMTDTKPMRIVAVSAMGERTVINFDHNIDTVDNHINAAKALVRKLGWDSDIVTGSSKNGYIHILVS